MLKYISKIAIKSWQLIKKFIRKFMKLSEGHSQRAASKPGKRSFERWWASVPEDLKQKARKGQKGNNNKPLLSHVNYVLLHLHLAGKHDSKPTSEELNYWLHSGQVNDKI